MKIVFVSNFLNHHQQPFSEELNGISGIDYTFIATSEMPEFRKELGYQPCKATYLLNSYDNKTQYHEAIKLINEADIVIYGSAPYAMIKKRKKEKKIIIGYAERVFKKNSFWPIVFLKGIKYRHIYNMELPMYMLCASAYAARDFYQMGLFFGKTYTWGYFPEFRPIDDIQKFILKKKHNSIAWAGRFIDWKHPEIPIILAERLKTEGFDFTLTMIGTGEQFNSISQIIKNKNLNDVVSLAGAMPPVKVRDIFDKSEIVLFTSDRNEGFGVVLLEAMSSACVTFADNMIGSVPFLTDENNCGGVYDTGDVDRLYELVKKIINDDDKKEKIAKKAYETIRDIWNPHEAAIRFVDLASQLIEKGSCDKFSDGPCSRIIV